MPDRDDSPAPEPDERRSPTRAAPGSPNPPEQPRRQGRPPDPDPEARRRLLAAARELMAQMPTSKVSVRAVAKLAGFDPALVNYYFGSKAGLVAAVLEDAAIDLEQRLAHIVQEERTLEDALKHAIHDAIRAIDETPYLSQLVIEQLLLGESADADTHIHRLATPYLWGIVDLVEQGIASRQFRPVDPRTLVFVLAASPLFFYLLTPIMQKVFGDDAVTPDAIDTFADAASDLVLYGVMARDEEV